MRINLFRRRDTPKQPLDESKQTSARPSGRPRPDIRLRDEHMPTVRGLDIQDSVPEDEEVEEVKQLPIDSKQVEAPLQDPQQDQPSEVEQFVTDSTPIQDQLDEAEIRLTLVQNQPSEQNKAGQTSA